MGNDFNTRKCVKALSKLGFTKGTKRRGPHDKYYPPATLKRNEGSCPFIMIPRHSELRLQDKILKELRNMGGEDLVNRFLGFL